MKDKFPKEVAVAFDGPEGERFMVVATNPNDHVSVHGKAVVGIYRLVEVVTVENYSRIVREK